MHPLPYHTQSLLDDLFERLTDGHDLTHRFHGGTNLVAYTIELVQVPAGDLHNHIINRRGYVSRVGGTHLTDLVERVPQCQLGGDEGQRVTRGLGGQRRGAAQTGIDLDDAVVVGLCVEGVLYVTLTHDTDMADRASCNILQLGDLLFGERDDRCHNNTFAGMDTQRVEVLHRHHGEAVVVTVADHLKLNLLPPFQALLNQYLAGEGEGTLAKLHELLLIGTDAGTLSSQRIGRAYHHRETDLTGSFQGMVKALHGT